MSDPLEGRFGWYRQANGGNFFMSVRQVLLAEKKIRCLSLLQQDVLLTASTINATLSKSDTVDERTYKWLTDFLLTVAIDEIPLVDATVTYYVSGYIARSTARLRKCSSCADLLISSNNIPTVVDECIPNKYQVIYKMANRGGLSIPTEFCFSVVLLAVQYTTAICANEENMKNLCLQIINVVFFLKR